MTPARLMVVLALAAVACQRGSVSTSTESSANTTTTATIAPTMPTSSAVGSVESAAPVPPPLADECSPGQPISPATLSASWPTRIGARVRFKGHVEMALDVMDAVVAAAGHRFIVVAGPDQLWEGEKERMFTVMGSKTVSLGGRTTLPQLLLESECAP
jgi:hypothetical protein